LANLHVQDFCCHHVSRCNVWSEAGSSLECSPEVSVIAKAAGKGNLRDAGCSRSIHVLVWEAVA
jgi:hypothetical protein